MLTLSDIHRNNSECYKNKKEAEVAMTLLKKINSIITSQCIIRITETEGDLFSCSR